MSNDKKVTVTVQYVGHDDYQHEFPAATLDGEVKLQAMKSFGLEPSAADKYVLQYSGVDQSDKAHLSTYDAEKVTFTLTLIHEVPKGGHDERA